MAHHSKELKQKLINDMSPPNSLTTPELSAKYGVPKQTIYSWRKAALAQGILVSKQANSSQWSNETKLAAIIETSIMTQAEKAEYCRKKGLYLEQLAQWKVACLSGFNTTPQVDKQQKSDLVSKDKQIKLLEKDLHRKNQALAESAALMVLSKKYRHHLLDEED